MITYRPLEKADVPVIFQLGKEHFGSPKQYSWDWNTAKVEEYVDSSFGTGIVCVDESNLVGFCLAQNKYSEQRPNVAWLTYVMVHPEHSGKGIGKDLTRKVEASLKSKGITEVITDIYEDNTKSLKFFEGQGFETKERWFILAKKI